MFYIDMLNIDLNVDLEVECTAVHSEDEYRL